jgi:hypothetical protein
MLQELRALLVGDVCMRYVLMVAGPARVFYSTGNNDTAVVGVNFDLQLNENATATSTSGWVVFADGVSSGKIAVQFINQPHNTTGSGNNVALSFSLSQCQVFNSVTNQWMASPGCSVSASQSSVQLEILDECSYITCENNGTCIDAGRSQPFCQCQQGLDLRLSIDGLI